ncbi:MAG: hypothetical protein HKN90_05650, partial [Flavobacteriaceae bacterium]|nr:hypothetical protein [Flavobacteriaceae bacterium]
MYKKIGLLLLFCFSTVMGYAQGEEVPRIVLFFGRFHPVLLHIPIGVLLVTFFIDIKGRLQKNYSENTIRSMLGFAAFFSVITSLLGYFLSLEGGYEQTILDYHFYLGLITTILIISLYYLSKKIDYHQSKVFLSVFIFSILSLIITGHFGSVLTHGENFLTEYTKPEKKSITITVVDSLRLYNDVIVKILDQKCYQCHNSNKMKGGLSLNSKKGILQGGESGEVIYIGNAHKSIMYQQFLLPITDEKHMPPEGKPQLSKDEIWMLKYWIDTNLDFDNYVSNVEQNDTLQRILANYLVFDKKVIPKADPDDLAELQSLGFMINELVPGSSELHIKYVKKEIAKNQLSKLKTIKKQIIELDLSNTNVTDGITGVIANLSNLKTLRLDNSKISDGTLKKLKNLKNLEVLNLYNT